MVADACAEQRYKPRLAETPLVPARVRQVTDFFAEAIPRRTSLPS